jgi:hypothetical protein
MNHDQKNQERRHRKPIIIRRVRPRYKKALIPALIVSLIIAIILIWIMSKYFLKPVLEGRGSTHQGAPSVAMESAGTTTEIGQSLMPMVKSGTTLCPQYGRQI